jgi:hypothetical protein
MNKVLYIILISLFSLTIISCGSSSDSGGGASTTTDNDTTDDDTTDDDTSDADTSDADTTDDDTETTVTTLASTVVNSVAITSASGVQNNLLNAGDNVSVTATFSESVIVDSSGGTPTLTLVVGSSDRTATYDSGSGSAPLVFRYTIQAGETDTDGISIGANVLALNSGTIRDAAGNNATLTHSAESANTSYKVDTTAPTFVSINPSEGGSIIPSDNISIVFSESIDGNSIITSGEGCAVGNNIEIRPCSTCSCIPTNSSVVNETITISRKWTSDEPITTFNYCENYRFKITNSIKDLSGNSLISNVESNFEVYIPNKYLLAGDNGKMYSSSTGVDSWTEVTTGFTDSIKDINCGTIRKESIIIATTGGGSPNNILKSIDNGTTWVKNTSNVAGTLNAVHWDNQTFVAVGDGGVITKNSQESIWASITGVTDRDMHGVVSGNGVFVAVGQDGKIISSGDKGSSWVNRSSGYTADQIFYDVAFGNNKFVAVGDSGKIVVSSDNGASWDNATSGVTVTLNAVHFNNGVFTAGGRTGILITSSDNGTSWISRSSGTTSLHLNDLTSDGSGSIIGTYSYTGLNIKSSDNGTSWSSSAVPQELHWRTLFAGKIK